MLRNSLSVSEILALKYIVTKSSICLDISPQDKLSQSFLVIIIASLSVLRVIEGTK
jgi:hypothetical protein